jgi:hypothetical protein
LYFEYDDGSGYFPIGHNVYRARSIWGYEREYKDYMTKMSAHGENYARVSVNALQNQFILALERARVGDQDAAGLGRYDLKNAWRLDRVLQLAEAHGICVTLGIENFPWFREKGEHARWAESPYNAANGGPCAEPAAFFTNPQAKKLYKRRLRYLVARWGYSPTILAWELWNEVNLVTGYASAPARDWHQEMARYLKALDVNRRLVATSYPTTPGDPRVEALPEMDYVQTHQYNSKDLAAEVSAVCLDKAHRYQKPHFFAETGLTPGTGLAEDPTGIHLHNAIWASAHSLGAGTAMLWWWDNYIEFRNLYHHYAALSKFVAGVQFNKHRFVPVKIESVHYSHPHPPRVRPLLLEGRSPVMKPQVLRVGSDGRVDAAETLSRNLYGTPDTVYWKHNPVTFKVNGDGPWRFSVWPATLYGKGAKIRARVDGRLELSKDLANPSGNSRSLAYEHAGEYAVNVPPGEHEIEVSNDGEGWLESAAYLFSGYCKPSDPPLRAFGLQEPGDPSDGLAALLWIQNTGNTWFLRSIGETPETVEDAVIRLRGFPDAEYQIEWWDTYGGKVIRREAAVGREALLEIPIPPVRADIVCKVFRGGRKGE